MHSAFLLIVALLETFASPLHSAPAARNLFEELLGKPERAATLIGWMHERMRLLRNEVPVPDDVASRPSVLYLRGAADRLDVGGRASYNHFVTELARVFP